jgi:hypothetical protein
MAKLTADRTYTRQQIGAELFGLTYGGSAKPRRESVLANVFGMIQVAPDKLLLRGINLFRRVTPNGSHVVAGMKVWERATDEWLPTEAALRLGESYHLDPNGIGWQQVLVDQIARYEPRTRLLINLLSHGYQLRFESSGYFSGRTWLAQLVGEKTYPLFSDKGIAFGRLLNDHIEVGIGPWWRQEIESSGFELEARFKLEGAMNRAPSMNDVSSALKASLRVFASLGILTENEHGWSVNVEVAARRLNPEVTGELLGRSHEDILDLSSEWQRLSHVVKTLADEQGFIVVSEAADHWGELSDFPLGERLGVFDSLLRRGIFEGRIEVLDRHPGQPRMGRGLFDDDNMRMIKLRVLT